MPRADNSYRLVIFDEPDDPQAVRDLICGVTGLHPTDVMQWVARAPGVWPHPLAEGEVREILDGLYELRVAAEAWRLDRLPVLYPPRNVHVAACLPEGLRVSGLRGEPLHWVPWDAIELVSAGRVEQEDEFRVITPPTWVQAVRTGLNALLRRPSIVARRERALRVGREPVCEVIVVRRDPRLAFRVAEDAMSYAYLGERKRPTASENFRLFLADLCERATGAYVTHPTRALLDPEADDPATFRTSQALMDYSFHRLLWSWYRRDRDAETGGSPGD